MQKKRKLRKYDAFRNGVVLKISKKYDCSTSFVNKAIAGERDSEKAIEIKKDFEIMFEAVNNAVTN